MTRTRLVRRFLVSVVFTVATLTFLFGFGNGYALGLRLGVLPWIAWLVAPAVDLSVVALLVVLQSVRDRSAVRDDLRSARLLLAFCGLVTLALNTSYAVVVGTYGRALFDAIAPLLLIGWSEVGPRVLALLDTVPDDQDKSGTVLALMSPVRDGRTDDSGPSAALIARAAEADTEQRAHTGRPITRDQLRAVLHVSNAVAGELLRAVRNAGDQER